MSQVPITNPIVGRSGNSIKLIPLDEVKKVCGEAEKKQDSHCPPDTEPKKADTKPLVHKGADAIIAIDPNLSAVVRRAQVNNYLDYPFRAAGRVFSGKNNDYVNWIKAGSGALVYKNLMITASHVVPWDPVTRQAYPGWWMRFVPAYNYGVEAYGESYVADVYGIENLTISGRDYVICHLYTPLGNTCGWFGSWEWPGDNEYKAGSWTSLGYPADSNGGQTMMIEDPVKIHDIDQDQNGKELESDFYGTPGWSGGPLWGIIGGQQRIIGVMSGWEDENDGIPFPGLHRESVHAGGPYLVDLVNYGMSTWPM